MRPAFLMIIIMMMTMTRNVDKRGASYFTCNIIHVIPHFIQRGFLNPTCFICTYMHALPLLHSITLATHGGKWLMSNGRRGRKPTFACP